MRTDRWIGWFIAGVWVLAACAAPEAQSVSTPAQTDTAAPTLTSAPPTLTMPPAVSAAVEPTATGEAVEAGAPAGGVSFAANVLPMLTNSCLNCHGGNKTEEGLSVKTYQSLLAGSKNGVVIVPGDALNSFMVEAIASGDMPKRGSKWTAEQLQILVDWINQGALNN